MTSPNLSRRLVLAAGAAACLAPPALAQTIGADDRLIVPGARIGAVRKGSTWSSLIEVYEPSHMRRDQIHVAEGEMQSGARIFPDKPEELEVAFASDNGPVDFVRIVKAGSPWRTASGIRIGATLAELEKLNGGPFRIMGFDWDYGGTVLLETAKKLPKGIVIGTSPRQRNRATAREYQQVVGDREIGTAHPVLKKIDVAVSSLVMSFVD